MAGEARWWSDQLVLLISLWQPKYEFFTTTMSLFTLQISTFLKECCNWPWQLALTHNVNAMVGSFSSFSLTDNQTEFCYELSSMFQSLSQRTPVLPEIFFTISPRDPQKSRIWRFLYISSKIADFWPILGQISPIFFTNKNSKLSLILIKFF